MAPGRPAPPEIALDARGPGQQESAAEPELVVPGASKTADGPAIRRCRPSWHRRSADEEHARPEAAFGKFQARIRCAPYICGLAVALLLAGGGPQRATMTMRISWREATSLFLNSFNTSD